MPVTIKKGDMLSEFGGDNELIVFNGHSHIDQNNELFIASPIMAGLKRLAPNFSSVFIAAFDELDKQQIEQGNDKANKLSICYGLIPYDVEVDDLKQKIALMHTRTHWDDYARPEFMCHSLQKLNAAVMYRIAYNVPPKRILVEDVLYDGISKKAAEVIQRLYNMCSEHIEIWRP